MTLKRAPTAYFIFADEIRLEVQEQVQASDPNGKAPVAVVGKAIGKRWALLTDAEKQKYKDIAAQKAQDLKSLKASIASQEESVQEENLGGVVMPNLDKGPPFGLPLSLVKKIMSLDPDVIRISGDGLKAATKATDLFIQLLAKKSGSVAKSHKRRTIKFSDMETAAKRDKRMLDMGLEELLQTDTIFVDARARIELENQTKSQNKKVLDTEKVPEGMQQLTSYFAPNSPEEEEEEEEGEEEGEKGGRGTASALNY